MGTTIPAARTALHAKLVAAPALANVQVTFGPPAEYEEAEVVALLGVLDPTEEPAALGRQQKKEEYILEIGVKAHDAAGTAQEVDTRGFALAEAAAAAVEAGSDLTLNGTVQTALIEYLRTDGCLPAKGGGWAIFIRVGVACVARIGH